MRRLIIILMGIVIALGIGACGGGHDTADTSGNDTLSVTTDKTELYSGQRCILTATVKNAGKEVVGREVTFGFEANMTGASLTQAKAITNAAGEAKTFYIAGTNAGSDVVRASISEKDRGYVNITVYAGGLSVTVTADPNPLSAGEKSTIAAIVKDAKGTAVSGMTVNFGFQTNDIGNNSGATLSPLSGLTDATGQATAIYTAGIKDSNNTLQDIVSATAESFSGMKIITRTAAGAAGMTVTVTADPNSLASGEKSTVAAIVKDAKGAAVSGMTVNFGFQTSDIGNNSGATLSPLSGLTDAAGQATAIYTAGPTSANNTVQDIVSATAGGYSGVKIITRTAAGAAGMTVAVTADPNSLAAGEKSTIAAIVKDAKGAAVPGVPVSFDIPTNNSGAAPLSDGTTDAAGQATTIYTAGGSSSNITVQDIVSATAGSYSGVEIITRTAAAAGMTLTVTADPNSLAAGEKSTIAAMVKDTKGTAVSGVNVNFSFPTMTNNSGTTLITNINGATLSPLSGGSTDAAGQATAIYTAGTTSANITVQDIVSATYGSYSGVEIITRTAAAAMTVTVSLSANPSSFSAWADLTAESILTATVTGSSGSSVSGIPVTFSIETGDGYLGGSSGTTTLTTNTNTKGEAVVRYTNYVDSGTAPAKTIVVLKAKLPDASPYNGTYNMITMEIDL